MDEFIEEFKAWLAVRQQMEESCVNAFSPIDGPENWTMGVELKDGTELFVTVEPA